MNTTLKTTKEQQDYLLKAIDDPDFFISNSDVRDLCHDANRAHALGWLWCCGTRIFYRCADEYKSASLYDVLRLYQEAADLHAKLEEAAYLKHRLNTIIPIFQEARDALTALTMAQVKLRGISSSLADRMDDAGTYNREKYDAEQRALKEQEKIG